MDQLLVLEMKLQQPILQTLSLDLLQMVMVMIMIVSHSQ
jgi:hypothetical protein